MCKGQVRYYWPRRWFTSDPSNLPAFRMTLPASQGQPAFVYIIIPVHYTRGVTDELFSIMPRKIYRSLCCVSLCSDYIINLIWEFSNIILGSVILICEIDILSSPTVNSLWPKDVIWRHKSESTLIQVMTCCQRTPQNLCWRFTMQTRWYVTWGNFT